MLAVVEDTLRVNTVLKEVLTEGDGVTFPKAGDSYVGGDEGVLLLAVEGKESALLSTVVCSRACLLSLVPV